MGRDVCQNAAKPQNCAQLLINSGLHTWHKSGCWAAAALAGAVVSVLNAHCWAQTHRCLFQQTRPTGPRLWECKGNWLGCQQNAWNARCLGPRWGCMHLGLLASIQACYSHHHTPSTTIRPSTYTQNKQKTEHTGCNSKPTLIIM